MRKTTNRIYLPLAAACVFCGVTACSKTDNPQQVQAAGTNVSADADPAAGNLAPADRATSDSTTSQTTSVPPTETYPANYDNPNYNGAGYAYDQAPPPPDTQDYSTDSGYDTASYDQPIETTVAPPPLPEYDQPPCPGDGYYWTPGYWGWDPDGYYWVPGAWVLAPWVDALWTPPYWAFYGGYYHWHPGYWGTHIGFYGGIDYGFGYTGRGYYGAYWNHGTLHYNRSVTNVNTSTVHNVYNYSAPVYTHSRVSYNGGHGGLTAQPTPRERAVIHDPRTPPVAVQAQHAREASQNRAQFATGGHAPAALVAARPLPTKYKAPAAQPPAAAVRAADRSTRPSVQNGPATPQSRQAQSAAPVPPGRQPGAPPATPEQRFAQRPEARAPQAPQQPERQPASAPQAHPALRQPPAGAHPEPQPNRPELQPNRPEPQPMNAPRSAPQVQTRPEPRQMSVPHQAPAQPAPEQHPAPIQQRPVPEAHPAAPQRPATQAAPPRPVPELRQERPVPEQRPAPQAAAPARPAPQPHEAPREAPRAAPPAQAPAPHPAPEPRQRPEERKDNK